MRPRSACSLLRLNRGVHASMRARTHARACACAHVGMCLRVRTHAQIRACKRACELACIQLLSDAAIDHLLRSQCQLRQVRSLRLLEMVLHQLQSKEAKQHAIPDQTSTPETEKEIGFLRYGTKGHQWIAYG